MEFVHGNRDVDVAVATAMGSVGVKSGRGREGGINFRISAVASCRGLGDVITPSVGSTAAATIPTVKIRIKLLVN